METATVRIPESKRDILKIIASVEKRGMKELLTEMIDNYVEAHKETLELFSNPNWVSLIESGKTEVENNVKGIGLDELDD